MRPVGYLTDTGDTRPSGDHSYSGWSAEETWVLPDGRAFLRTLGRGVFTHDYAEELEVQGTPKGELRPLPMVVVTKAELTQQVPPGLVVIQQRSGGEKSWDLWSDWCFWEEGDEVPAGILDEKWARFHGYTILKNGESCEVHQSDYHHPTTWVLLTNKDGLVVETDV